MAWLVFQPSLPGTENSCLSARVAGPAAMIPAIVRTTHESVTMRLCFRTQRVREATALPPAAIQLRADNLYHKRFALDNVLSVKLMCCLTSEVCTSTTAVPH